VGSTTIGGTRISDGTELIGGENKFLNVQQHTTIVNTLVHKADIELSRVLSAIIRILFDHPAEIKRTVAG
jgi:hypothetical protein